MIIVLGFKDESNKSDSQLCQEAYDDFALFFYDQYGGDTIAVLWKPSVRIPKEFKVNLCYIWCVPYQIARKNLDKSNIFYFEIYYS